MVMPSALRTAPVDNRTPRRASSWPGTPRQYAMGQEVRVRMRNQQWRNGCIIAFGNQEYLPLYWVRIDGTPQEALAFEFELSSRDGN